MGVNYEAEKRAYQMFIDSGMSVYGACGLIGNLEAESDGFFSNRVEYLCLKRLKENGIKDQSGNDYTDETYTAAVDAGRISCETFLNPLPGKQYGYGLAQWTSPGRKAGLWNMAKEMGVSIADEKMQLTYLLKELNESYYKVMVTLKTATSIREASDMVLKKYEIPADTSEKVCASRAARGQLFFEKFVKNGTVDIPADKDEPQTEKVIEKATVWMENTAKEKSHGYDQIYRWGEKGDYDCSSGVITAWEYAGVPVKTHGATYTGNMRRVFLNDGFKDITSQIDISTGAGLERGDVLLNEKHHVAMYCGSGKEVEASINEKGTATGGKPGDQTGKEFLVRSYRNYPWTHILRYVGTESAEASVLVLLRRGSEGEKVSELQQNLNELISAGLVIDGDFGGKTYAAVISFQMRHGLVADGIVGSQTQGKIDELLKKQALPEKNSSGPSKDRKFVGEVTASLLYVRTYAGTEYDTIKSWPALGRGNLVDVCDTVLDAAGEEWYYIRIADKYYGFSKAEYIKRA